MSTVPIPVGIIIKDAHIVVTTPTTGQVLKYDGTNWVNGTDNDSGGGGGVSDGDKGDITVSGSGTVYTIDNLAVTNAKINDVAATKVTEDSTHRFATDAEKSTWNGKQDALGFTAENVSNKAVDLDVINDTLYPTVALLDSLVNAKQNTLVSGTNIKTINSTSLLGSGDIVISGGSGNVGEATLSFGSTPTNETTVTVTGQGSILTTSKVKAWVMGATTASNNEGEHLFAGFSINVVSNIPTASIGFTLYATTLAGYVTGDFKVKWEWI